MALWRDLERRRCGILSPSSFADRLRPARARRLELSVDLEIKSPHRGTITWLDVDRAEERYLITGGADCTIAVFDLDGASEKQESPNSPSTGAIARRNINTVSARRKQQANKRRPRELRRIGHTKRTPLSQGGAPGQAYGGHYHSVSVVRWYPVDTGLFISGGMDGVVKLWDTNALDVVLEFNFQEKVFAAAMSGASGQHHLIAVGNDSTQVRLCDIRSGAFSHALTGHSEAVWACAWSPISEFLLATGSADQTARLWDIRRSGASSCLISLDQHRDEEEGDEGHYSFVSRATSGKGGTGGSGDGGGVAARQRGYMKHYKLAPQASRVSKFARAHSGPVNSMCFTPNGLHLLTAGTDNRLRLWEVETGRNTMMNYLQTKNRRRRPFGMAVAQPAGRRSETVFFPNDKSGDVLAFPLHSVDGQPSAQLRAHFDPVQCCAYRPRTQELVSGGADGLILLWSPGAPSFASRASYLPGPANGLDGRGAALEGSALAGAGEGMRNGIAGGKKRRLVKEDEDEDMWSSDDDGGGGDGGDGEVVGTGSGGGAGVGVDGDRGRGEGVFVPPILMQRQRPGRDRRREV